MKPRLYYEIQEILKRNGYNVYSQWADNYIWSVMDYLDMQDNDYTVLQWFDDTKKNYPQDLEELGRC